MVIEMDQKITFGQNKKYIVVDTSALMELPQVFSLLDGIFLVPLTVIKQLDRLKLNQDVNKSKFARQASYAIEKGIKAGYIQVLNSFDKIDALDNESDNKIVGAAVRFKRNNPELDVCLLATDRNVRIAATGFGIDGLDLYGIPLEKNNPVKNNPVKKNVKTKPPFYSYFLIVAGAGGGVYGLFNGVVALMPMGICLFLIGVAVGVYPRIVASKNNEMYYGDYKDAWSDDQYSWPDEDKKENVVVKNLQATGSLDPLDWRVL